MLGDVLDTDGWGYAKQGLVLALAVVAVAGLFGLASPPGAKARIACVVFCGTRLRGRKASPPMLYGPEATVEPPIRYKLRVTASPARS